MQSNAVRFMVIALLLAASAGSTIGLRSMPIVNFKAAAILAGSPWPVPMDPHPPSQLRMS